MLHSGKDSINSHPEPGSFFQIVQSVHGWCPKLEDISKQIDSSLEDQQTVYLYVEDYFLDYQMDYSRFRKISKDQISKITGSLVIIISDRDDFPRQSNLIHVIPKQNILGISCTDDINFETIQTDFALFMSINHLAWDSISVLSSLDINSENFAIYYLAHALQAKMKFCSSKQLQEFDINYQSQNTEPKTQGVGNVAASAAHFASGNIISIPQFNSRKLSLALSHQKSVMK